MATRRASKTKNEKDAIALLEKDHKAVQDLLNELERTTARSVKKRDELAARIALEVEVHAAIEEELLYPAFREKAESSEDEKLYFEAQEEHGLVHLVLPELLSTDSSTEQFSARAKVLKDLVEHHVEEEEQHLFPHLREIMSSNELTELGVRLEERKRQLLELGGPEDGDGKDGR